MRVLHSENTGPERTRNSKPTSKLGLCWMRGFAAITSGQQREKRSIPESGWCSPNSTVGWYRFDKSVKHAHFFHGTYRGQAEAIRPYIKYRGYLRMKWWDAMTLERYSGKNNIALCCSEPIRKEIHRLLRV